MSPVKSGQSCTSASIMAQKFYEKLSWSPKDKTEKTVHRHGCCDLMRICRRRGQSVDYPPDRASVHECMKLLEELLADGGCARDVPVSCRCREDPRSLAWILSPMFQVLSRHHEEERRLREVLRSPLHLLRGLFLPLDVMRHCHKMVTAVPGLQDLLEVCCTVLVPRPRGTCVSCREHRAVASEVSAGKRHKSSNQQTTGRRCEERRRTRDVHEYLCHPEQSSKLSENEERSNQRQKPGLLASVQQLNNSLKKDLETHQLYLRAIETRLSGLERRTQDVTEHLERANLELEAIKQGSVTLKTLVEEQISSPVTEDLEDLEEGLWGQWQRSGRPESFRKYDPGPRCTRDPPAGGGGVHQRDLQTGLSSCQRHVDVLLQQITQQINQMESEIKFTSKLRQSAG